MKITIPTSLSEITLNQYLHFKKVAKEAPDDDEFLKLSLVTLFCGLTIEQAKSIPFKEFNEIADILTQTLTQEANFVSQFTLNGVKYGFIPNLDNMTQGEYIDLERYPMDSDAFYNAMAIFFRPVIRESMGMYEIEPYESSEKYKDALINMPLEAALGVNVFFCRLSSELLKATRTCLANPTIAEPLEVALVKSGAGMHQLTRLLKDAESALRRQPN